VAGVLTGLDGRLGPSAVIAPCGGRGELAAGQPSSRRLPVRTLPTAGSRRGPKRPVQRERVPPVPAQPVGPASPPLDADAPVPALHRRCTGTTAPSPEWLRGELAGRRAYAGLDLAAKLDMTAWALIVPDGLDDGGASMLRRFWLPEAAVAFLDKRTNGRVSRWADAGWITVTPGDVIDYDVIYADVAADCKAFRVMAAGYDEWSGEPARQAIQKRTRLDMVPIPQTFRGMTYGMTELMELTKSRGWAHHGNPVAEWCFDAVEVRHPPGDADQLRPDKPDRNAVGKRIDVVPTAAMAITRWRELAAKHNRAEKMIIR
jgi:phage terminase large subunit-like protein